VILARIKVWATRRGQPAARWVEAQVTNCCCCCLLSRPYSDGFGIRLSNPPVDSLPSSICGTNPTTEARCIATALGTGSPSRSACPIPCQARLSIFDSRDQAKLDQHGVSTNGCHNLASTTTWRDRRRNTVEDRICVDLIFVILCPWATVWAACSTGPAARSRKAISEPLIWNRVNTDGSNRCYVTTLNTPVRGWWLHTDHERRAETCTLMMPSVVLRMKAQWRHCSDEPRRFGM
jgi:hypothetical protein